MVQVAPLIGLVGAIEAHQLRRHGVGGEGLSAAQRLSGFEHECVVTDGTATVQEMIHQIHHLLLTQGAVGLAVIECMAEGASPSGSQRAIPGHSSKTNGGKCSK